MARDPCMDNFEGHEEESGADAPRYSIYDFVEKVCDWFEAQAKRCDQNAKSCRFITLKEAYEADAANYRAMAKQGREVLKGLVWST